MRRKITDKIREWDISKRHTALVISGARQVGKTYIINEYCRFAYPNRLCINFAENPDACKIFRKNLDAESLIAKMSVQFPDFRFVPGKTIVFLDEIQECPDVRTALKPPAADGRYRIVASDSLLGLGLEKVRLVPVGYEEEIKLGPMDFEEYLCALGMSEETIGIVKNAIKNGTAIDETFFERFSEYYRWFLITGGMPEAVSALIGDKRISSVRTVQKGILRTYVDDVGKHARKDQKAKIIACFRAIPEILAKENKKFEYSRIIRQGYADENETAEYGKRVGYDVGHKYFEPAPEWLSPANVSLLCSCITEPRMPFEERRRKMFKMYMLDTGLLTCMYDPSEINDLIFGIIGVNKGAVAENAVAISFALQDRPLLYCSQTRGEDRMGIDFVTVINGRPCAVEVKSGTNTRCKSFNRVMTKYGIDGIMFETGNIFTDDKGVRHFPLFAASFMDSTDPPKEILSISGMRRLLSNKTAPDGAFKRFHRGTNLYP